MARGRTAPRSELRFAVVSIDGERVAGMAPSFIDRKQKLARQQAARKSLERRERVAERRTDRPDRSNANGWGHL